MDTKSYTGSAGSLRPAGEVFVKIIVNSEFKDINEVFDQLLDSIHAVCNDTLLNLELSLNSSEILHFTASEKFGAATTTHVKTFRYTSLQGWMKKAF